MGTYKFDINVAHSHNTIIFTIHQFPLGSIDVGTVGIHIRCSRASCMVDMY